MQRRNMEENQNDRQQKKENSYKSLEDWYRDNKHFKWPLIIFFIVILILIILIDLKII
jgi:type IV secretory pathway component VirB8